MIYQLSQQLFINKEYRLTITNVALKIVIARSYNLINVDAMTVLHFSDFTDNKNNCTSANMLAKRCMFQRKIKLRTDIVRVIYFVFISNTVRFSA